MNALIPYPKETFPFRSLLSLLVLLSIFLSAPELFAITLTGANGKAVEFLGGVDLIFPHVVPSHPERRRFQPPPGDRKLARRRVQLVHPPGEDVVHLVRSEYRLNSRMTSTLMASLARQFRDVSSKNSATTGITPPPTDVRATKYCPDSPDDTTGRLVEAGTPPNASD